MSAKRVPLLVIGLALLFGGGAGADLFVPRGRIPVGANPSAIVVQDLNDDGLPDIVTADRGVLTDPKEERPANDELSLLMASGSLEYTKHNPSLKTGFGPYAIALANIDALKWPDIIVASFHAERGQNISLFLNIHPEDVFEPIYFNTLDERLAYHRQTDSNGVPVFTVPGLTSLDVAFIDGDNLRDLIATGWSSDVLVYMPGDLEGHFGAPQFIPAAGAPRDLRLVDLDGDDALDLVVAMYASSEVSLWKGLGNGQFNEVDRFPTRGLFPNKVRVADMNRDGTLDIVVSHSQAHDSIVIFYGDGNFQYSVSQEVLLGPERDVLEHGISDLVVTDFNSDSRPDLAASCANSQQVAVYINVSSQATRRQEFHRENYVFDDGKPHALASGDLNADGASDLAVALWDANCVALLIQQ